jgi:hypothetical protein
MGLDITYYRNAKIPTAEQLAALNFVPEDDRFDKADELGMRHPYINPDFPGRDEGLPQAYWLVADCAGGFAAGSYSGYGRWRESLARLSGWHRGSSGPFSEMINFADNEGVIGPVVSAKLAKDFAEWQDRAQDFAGRVGDDGWFMRKYAEWRKAFEAAADGGYVDFH